MKFNRSSRRDMNFETMEKRELFAADLGMDLASPAPPPVEGNSPGIAEIDFVEVGGSEDADKPVCYLKYKLDRAFIKSWSTSGDADDRPTEEVAFYYNKIGHEYAQPEAIDETFAAEDTVPTADDRPTEEVAFYYNKIAFGYAATTDGIEPTFNEPSSAEIKKHSAKTLKVGSKGDAVDAALADEGLAGSKKLDVDGIVGPKTADSFSFGVEREMKESVA